MSEKRPPNARRRILIHPKFQLLLLGSNLAIILIYSAIIWTAVQAALVDLRPLSGLSSQEVAIYRHYVEYQSHNFNSALAMGMMGGILISAALTLVISHRMAGPLIRLRNFFRSVGEGTGLAPKLTFREKDYFTDLPPLINRALTRLGTEVPEEPKVSEEPACGANPASDAEGKTAA